MPGTIQISVLEFKGLPVESSPSLLKVSLGKREYRTSDMNEFSFPLTTLRDNLVVTLQDEEGNELAHLGIRTMSIVEKVSWDDIFPLDGGGYLHLKLKFMLTEHEQTRIRAMREAAMKEKQVSATSAVNDAGPSSSHIEQTVSDSETSSVLEAPSLSNPGILHPDFREEYKEIPKDMDDTRSAKKIDTKSYIHRTPLKFVFSENASSSCSDSLNIKDDQVSGEKIVSKVKIIANAFESGLAKDVKYPLSPSGVKPGGKKVLKGGNSKEYEATDSFEERDITSGIVAEGSKLDNEGVYNKISAESYVDDVESLATVRSRQSNSVVFDPTVKGMSTANLDTSSTSETTTNSGTEQSSTSVVIDPTVDDTRYSDSDRLLTSETASTPGKKLNSNSENLHLFGPSDGDQIEVFLNHKTDEEKIDKDIEESEDTKKSIPESSSNDAWNGLVAQAVKFALIIGFGVLVFVTRQKQPRKTSKNEEGLNIFKPSDYINGEAEKWIDI